MIEISLNIKKARELKGYTQAYIAKKLSITQKAYSLIESDYSKLTVDRLFTIAKILDNPIEDLLNLNLQKVSINGNNNINHQGANSVFKPENVEKIEELYERIIELEKTVAKLSKGNK